MSTPFPYADLALLTVELPDSLKNLRYAGRFSEELAEIDRLLSPDTQPHYDPIMTKRLELERFFASHLAEEYTLTPARMTELIRQNLAPSFTEDDLPALINEGHADYVNAADGIRFHADAYANVRGCCGAFFHRLNHPDEPYEPGRDTGLHDSMRYLRGHGKSAFRYTLREWIAPDEAHRRPMKRFRAWLPFPAVCAEQSGIRLLGASHQAYVSPGPIATVYGEFPYHAGEKFEITLTFTNTAVYHELSDGAAKDFIPEEVRGYLAEYAPHIVFTPYLRQLAAYLAGRETNPLVKARRIYDYVTHFVKYSYMREYRLLDNIPMYAALNGRGDCGVQALLFITLCRIAGIPARWQSGNACYPDSVGSHDWAQFYVEPWGWLYADPSYGGGMVRGGDEAGAAWYFGNLDPYRYVCCTEFQRQLDPAKTYMRLDPYDNQSGEAEYEDEVLDPGDCRTRKEVLSGERVL